MTLSEFLKENQVSFVKPTNNGNGLNFRTADGQLVATVMTPDCGWKDSESQELLMWVKDHFHFTVSSNSQNQIIRLNAPVDKGVELAGLWDEPAAPVGKKVKA